MAENNENNETSSNQVPPTPARPNRLLTPGADSPSPSPEPETSPPAPLASEPPTQAAPPAAQTATPPAPQPQQEAAPPEQPEVAAPPVSEPPVQAAPPAAQPAAPPAPQPPQEAAPSEQPAIAAPPVSAPPAQVTPAAAQPVTPPAPQQAAAHPVQPEVAAPPVSAPPAQVTPSVQPTAPPPQQAAPPPQQAAPPPAPQITVPLAGNSQNTPAVNPLLVGSAPPASPPQGQAPAPAAAAPGVSPVNLKPKKGISNAVKVMIAVTLLALIILAAVIFKGKSDNNEWIERRNAIVAYFNDLENPPTEIPMTGDDVGQLLGELASSETRNDNERELYFRALSIAKATDGSDIGEMVANFAKDSERVESATRVKLFRVTGRRAEASALPSLIAFASQTDDTTSGQAALTAASKMASISNFQSLLGIIANSPNASIKSSARMVLSKVIADSEDPSKYATPVIASYKSVADPDSSAALLRLMGSAGGDEAADLVADQLESKQETMKVAAALALSDWPDDSQFETLLEYTKSEGTDRLRSKAFEALVDFLKICPNIDPDDRSFYWNDVAAIASGEVEQRRVIRAMSEQDGRWADDILDYFIENADSNKVRAAAEVAKDRLDVRLRRAERSGTTKEDDKKDDDE